jgi:transposase
LTNFEHHRNLSQTAKSASKNFQKELYSNWKNWDLKENLIRLTYCSDTVWEKTDLKTRSKYLNKIFNFLLSQNLQWRHTYNNYIKNNQIRKK